MQCVSPDNRVIRFRNGTRNNNEIEINKMLNLQLMFKTSESVKYRENDNFTTEQQSSKIIHDGDAS